MLTLKDVLTKDIRIQIILNINNEKTTMDLYKRIRCSWAAICVALKGLEKERFLRSEKRGRDRHFRLTGKGKTIKDILTNLNTILKEGER